MGVKRSPQNLAFLTASTNTVLYSDTTWVSHIVKQKPGCGSCEKMNKKIEKPWYVDVFFSLHNTPAVLHLRITTLHSWKKKKKNPLIRKLSLAAELRYRPSKNPELATGLARIFLLLKALSVNDGRSTLIILLL